MEEYKALEPLKQYMTAKGGEWVQQVQVSTNSAVRDKITRNRLSYVWLISQLRERGIVTDKSEMSSVLSGTRVGPKANLIGETSLQILNDYESKFAAPKAP